MALFSCEGASEGGDLLKRVVVRSKVE